MATKTDQISGLLRGVVVVGTAKVNQALADVKENLKIDLGSVLLNVYQRYRQDGWTENDARKMTLKLAKQQLGQRIVELRSQGGDV